MRQSNRWRQRFCSGLFTACAHKGPCKHDCTDHTQTHTHTQRYTHTNIELSFYFPSKPPNGFLFIQSKSWSSPHPQTLLRWFWLHFFGFLLHIRFPGLLFDAQTYAWVPLRAFQYISHLLRENVKHVEGRDHLCVPFTTTSVAHRVVPSRMVGRYSLNICKMTEWPCF